MNRNFCQQHWAPRSTCNCNREAELIGEDVIDLFNQAAGDDEVHEIEVIYHGRVFVIQVRTP